jgi:CubicO group peptidase (beta-lactamase class C family)
MMRNPLPTILFTTLLTLAGTPAEASSDWPACGVVETYPDESWAPRRSASGWNAALLAQARETFQASNADSLMIVHRGHVVAQWGAVDEPRTVQSMRKPMLNALIGQLVEEGGLSLDATLESLDINDSDPALTLEERTATVRDLMLARSGIMHDANYEHGSWRRLRVAIRENEPGSRRGLWFYNNWDFNALGTIVEDAGAASLAAQFDARIAEPLDMEDYDPALVSYSGRNSGAQRHFGYGSDHPAYMFEMSTRDLARFGLLYLGCGRWREAQLLSETWVRDSMTGVDTRRGLPASTRTGFDAYGLLWWVEKSGEHARFPQLAHAQPYFGGSGFRGHFLLVFPRFDLVIAHQPRTVGGIGDAAQLARVQSGSPSVSDQEFAQLVELILRAHPGVEPAAPALH